MKLKPRHKSKELLEALQHLANVIIAFGEMNPLPRDYQNVSDASLWLQKRSKKWKEVCAPTKSLS